MAILEIDGRRRYELSDTTQLSGVPRVGGSVTVVVIRTLTSVGPGRSGRGDRRLVMTPWDSCWYTSFISRSTRDGFRH